MLADSLVNQSTKWTGFVVNDLSQCLEFDLKLMEVLVPSYMLRAFEQRENVNLNALCTQFVLFI